MKEVTMRKLRNHLDNDEQTIHGVYYNNSIYSRRYLAQDTVYVQDIDISNNRLKMSVTTRVEFSDVGIEEVNMTKEALHYYEAGTVPHYLFYDKDGNQYQPHEELEEPVTATMSLISMEVLLEMDQPRIYHRNVVIGGQGFDLFEIHQDFDGFKQSVQFLFGRQDKLTFLSHFHGKKLNMKDSQKILELIVKENVTGKAIVGIRSEAEGMVTNLTPVRDMITSIYSFDNEPIFTTDGGYVKLTKSLFKTGTFEAQFLQGSPRSKLKWKNNHRTVEIFFE